jgi:hypothetical protein
MAIPTLQWLRIVEYGDFHDVPHQILALDRDMAFWIFEGGFDDALDDYPRNCRYTGSVTMPPPHAMHIACGMPTETSRDSNRSATSR